MFIASLILVPTIPAIFGLPDNAVLSEKYQTLVTPSGSTFAIWGVIFIAEGIFSVMQMMPKYRNHPMVVEGAKYNFALACFTQVVWTLVFSYEVRASEASAKRI
jgi:hypothetical protein